MRHACLILLTGLLCGMLTGCSIAAEVENQAYALVMGVDSADDGGIELTIRIPRIGHGGAGGESSGGQEESYLLIAAAGGDYAQALENLQWAVARELNLSHLKLLIVSEALAKEARFPALIREIAETRHLYTTAGFIVCEGQARSFIEGQETLLGSHLSSDIDAMFRHYATHGFIANASFADLYYATNSCYSDPVGIWSFPDSGERPASATIESNESALNAETKTSSSRQYLGTALFREGTLVGHLNAAETLCLNLLTHGVNDFSFDALGSTWPLSSALPTRISVKPDPEGMRIDIDLYLTCAKQGNLSAVEEALAESVKDTIDKCRDLKVEPFGFAVKAAAHFPTLGAWRDYDWRNRFPESVVRVKAHIAGSE